MNILIADDDSTSRIVLSATLKKLGHQVTVANSGSEALAIFNAQDVPLLISDMVMPEVDGLELCRRIRAANHSQYTYIILLTSVGGKWGYAVGMKAGADDFINKPLDEEQLSARLEMADRILRLEARVKELSELLRLQNCSPRPELSAAA
jgi:two-component system cell cycle response regulator